MLHRSRMGEILGSQFAGKLFGKMVTNGVGVTGAFALDEFD
jgi:hypothetical protein